MKLPVLYRITLVAYDTRVQVPSEAFRLGRTRVFFRAGQISTLQKILNETGPEKAPWIMKRLKEALASRHEAKAAAEEAQVRGWAFVSLTLFLFVFSLCFAF